MKLFYFKCAYGNFGDDLNEWFWDQVLPGWQEWEPETYLVGLGSILNQQILPQGKKLVIGTGSGYGALPDISAGEWDIRGVRGPLTCERLGLSKNLALSDPAILLPLLEPFTNCQKNGKILFVPHINSDKFCDWKKICTRLGISYQSPSIPYTDMINKIAGADKVIAESMHAAIIADAFGVPWSPVKISNNFNEFKWNDWAHSLDHHDLKFRQFFPTLRKLQAFAKKLTKIESRTVSQGVSATNAFVHSPTRGDRKVYLEIFAPYNLKTSLNGKFQLTDRTALKRQQDKLLDVLHSVKKDYCDSGVRERDAL